MGGRLTLIKSVLCLIPIYSLSIRILPVRLRNTLHGIMNRFLQGGTDDLRKFHLVSQDEITKACNCGGLGVPNLGEMNAVLLVKCIYRHGKEENQLWRNVVNAKSGSNSQSLALTFSGRTEGRLWPFQQVPCSIRMSKFRMLLARISTCLLGTEKIWIFGRMTGVEEWLLRCCIPESLPW